MADPLAVRIRNLKRGFDGRAVLTGIDLDVRAGEFVALLGRSGSGKSTLLRILCGFDGDADGELQVASRRSIVFQEPRLQPWLRVLTNVCLGLRGPNVKTRAREALEEVGLVGRERSWPLTLSGGEAQRVGLARAMVREPDLLLLDEPFGALDALTRLKMHELLRSLCRAHEPAVILVTHDVDEALVLADRILVLTEGRISLDLDNDQSMPGLHTELAVAEKRTRLLAELGVHQVVA
ncbi:ABC transporter ATP-binding protein [Sphingobium cloacae]|nr:ABC transporter ATP-binding protein [Sphingobium cloacae]